MSQAENVSNKLVYSIVAFQTGNWGGAPSRRRLGGLGAKPPNRWTIFCKFFEKKSYFNAIGSYFARVPSHLKELDF